MPEPVVATVNAFDVTWKERLAVLGPLGGVLITLVILGNLYAPAQSVELLGLIPAAMFAVGKFLPLWGISGQSSLGPWELGAVVWFLDTMSVIFIVYSLEAFYRIRPLKRALDRINGNAQLVLAAYPGIRKAAVVGVILFVLFPVTGTGALAGAFIGVLLGMNRFVLIGAVSCGGCIGGFFMAFLAVNFESALSSFQDNSTYKYAAIATAVMLIVIGVYFLNRAFQRALVKAKAQE